jgi:hypothetical protein
MSIDLQDLFNEEGLGAPPTTLDTDYVIRRGRRVRARRRAVVGTSAFVGAGVVAVGSVALVGATSSLGQPGVGSTTGSGANANSTTAGADTANPPVSVTVWASPPVDGSTTPRPLTQSPSGTPTPTDKAAARATPPADIAAVSLANPAPGFPIRRWKDDLYPEFSTPGRAQHWVALFGLAVRPEITSTPSPGLISARPNGPEVTIFVGDYPTPVHLEGLGSRPVSGSPAVAGVVGHLAEYTEKGTTFSVLYFSTGKFTVEIIGAGVTTAQLVALGDALTGLQ